MSSTQNGKHRHHPHNVKPQTNLSIENLSQLSAISPVAQTYDDDSLPADEEHLTASRAFKTFQRSATLFTEDRNAFEEDSNDTLSPIEENDDNEIVASAASHAPYPEDLNPFASRKTNKNTHPRVSNQQANWSFDGGVPPELEYSFNSTGNFSTKSMPIMLNHGKQITQGGLSGAWNSSVYAEQNSCGGTAAEIAKSRYALQNKKLLEELEHRT